MSGQVVSLSSFRLAREAERMGEIVRSLVADLRLVRGRNGATDEEARHEMACYWLQQGWANEREVRLALKELEIE